MSAGRPRWWPLGRRASQVFEAEAVPAGSVQLVWANMTLHAARDPLAVLAQWQRALAVGGFVMFSCFGPDTARELRALYQRLGWASPGAPFVDMHDLGDMALHAGFADPVMDQEQVTLSWPDAAALVAELRGLGANAAPDRHPGWRTPRWRARLLDEVAGPGRAGRAAASDLRDRLRSCVQGRTAHAGAGRDHRAARRDARRDAPASLKRRWYYHCLCGALI